MTKKEVITIIEKLGYTPTEMKKIIEKDLLISKFLDGSIKLKKTSLECRSFIIYKTPFNRFDIMDLE